MKKIGIYVHIPFCKQKCLYCDFCSYENCMEMQDEYVNALIEEIKYYKNKKDFIVNTIYIGGGTPSILKKENIEKILKEIKLNFEIDNNSEITIEVNPGTIDIEKVESYKKNGINRISIGLQSANDNILKMLGRIHSYQQFLKAYNMVKNEVKINNINIDLIIGLPKQTIQDVADTIEEIIKKNPNHISVYSLIVEKETKMEELISKGSLKLPPEDVEREMYWLVKNKLKENGYYQYEISNFAKKGFESKHNINCWKQNEYLGFGVAAHSYYNLVRKSNITNLKDYIKNIEEEKYEKNIIVHEIQNKDDQMSEYIILGLRMLEGFSKIDFKSKFEIDIESKFGNKLDKLKKQSLIIEENDMIKLTNKGLDFANIVWEEFL